MTAPPIIISIDGNIGSGKSTIMEKLKEYYNKSENVVFLKEPVDEWESIKDNQGISILQKFYTDQEKYAYSFQMMAYISRLKILKEATLNNPPNTIFITERSLFTDKMVFAKMLYDSGKIEDINYKIYLKWFNLFTEEFPLNKIIYLKTSPEICYTRIHSRARSGEEIIPLEYLVNCDKYHDNMMIDFTVKQLKLNGNINMHENIDIYNIYLTQINDFIMNIK
jgi:deoxyadenosine/deoxycytidine kinase